MTEWTEADHKRVKQSLESMCSTDDWKLIVEHSDLYRALAEIERLQAAVDAAIYDDDLPEDIRNSMCRSLGICARCLGDGYYQTKVRDTHVSATFTDPCPDCDLGRSIITERKQEARR
jgi:hypothetical protein